MKLKNEDRARGTSPASIAFPLDLSDDDLSKGEHDSRR